MEVSIEAANQSSAAAFPVADWDKYEFIALLGKGGMGAVYKARDRKLDRIVALKFIRGDDPLLAQRFLQEAHAQARLEHPNICRVYEVGHVQDKPYIAMQFVEGKSLNGLRAELNLHDKILIIRDVALAMHEAHRLGIIHRDIKPNNILCERLSDDGFRPLVMDFGLALDGKTNRGLTETGAVMGTPAYMPPEQARGNSRHLDRRADVYSIGATLYELLTGLPPFDGEQVVDIILSVLSDEPRPVRALARDVPADLETIVLKCLAKEPPRRYDSARALAEDLQRYVDGEPIQGKRTTVLYRLRRKVHRNRGLVLLGTVALLLTLVLGGFGLNAELRSRRQVRLAQELGQSTKELELFMRAAYSLPIHDIRRELSIVRIRMARLRDQLNDAPHSDWAAPLHYALGRGHLVLREYGAAYAELDRSWQQGHRTGESRLALGLALGELYRQELEQARQASDRKWIQAKEKELEARLLKPALSFLDGASNPLEAPALVEGLLALYRKQYDMALAKAQLAQSQAPWLAEPLKLEGDAYKDQAIDLIEHGQFELAVATLKKALHLHQAAAAIGRSDSALHESEALDWLWLLATKEHTGEPIADTADKATAACDRAIVANPTLATVYQTQASVYWRSAILSLNQNQNPTDLVKKSITASQKAVALDPNNWLSHYGIGVASGLLIQQQSSESSLDDNTVNSGISALRAAIRLNPNAHWAWGDLGNVYIFRMINEMQHGAFKKEFYDLFISSTEKAVELRPDIGNPLAILSYGSSLVAEFHLNHGLPHDNYVANTIRYAKGGLAINPSEMNHVNNEANGHLIAAASLISRKADPASELSSAQSLISRSFLLNPQFVETHQLAVRLEFLRALHSLRNSLPLNDPVTRGLDAAARGQKIAKDDPVLLMYQSRLHLLLGQANADDKALALARSEAMQAAKLAPKLADVQDVLCESFRHSVAVAAKRQKTTAQQRAEASGWIDSGLAACAAVLSTDATRVSARDNQAALLSFREQLLPTDAARPRLAPNPG